MPKDGIFFFSFASKNATDKTKFHLTLQTRSIQGVLDERYVRKKKNTLENLMNYNKLLLQQLPFTTPPVNLLVNIVKKN